MPDRSPGMSSRGKRRRECEPEREMRVREIGMLSACGR
ncbi:hypothetical protein AKJ09_01879 [Labilithrix luteola]|uniref:Uncharacterized protein n=1 Tax=Labilithrix luteola TaxID=1391654 RepID=A0A0K1PNW0_9BACT|nr:hypothetical protein AKJ09_01879 [Labilithrix luteola]